MLLRLFWFSSTALLLTLSLAAQSTDALRVRASGSVFSVAPPRRAIPRAPPHRAVPRSRIYARDEAASEATDVAVPIVETPEGEVVPLTKTTGEDHETESSETDDTDTDTEYDDDGSIDTEATDSTVDTTSGPTERLSDDDFAAWTTAARYAAAVYCNPERIASWTCGLCPLLGGHSAVVGGDGERTPRWYVAHNDDQIIVAIAGMNASSPDSVSLAFDFTRVSPSFGPAAASVLVHRGVDTAASRIWHPIVVAVLDAAAAANTRKVLVVGHSFGGALAHVLGPWLADLSTGQALDVTVRAFVPPRTGNAAWADYADGALPSPRSQYMVRRDDATPHLPPRAWGFRHRSGEVWINRTSAVDEYVVCSGQENAACADSKNEGSIFQVVGNIPRFVHIGPFANVIMFCLG